MKIRSLFAAGSLIAAAIATVPLAPTYAADPVLTGGPGNQGFVEADPYTASAPVVIDPGIALNLGSASGIDTAAVAITGNLHASEDVLGFVGSPGSGDITGSFNAMTGVLTLASTGGSATAAQWQEALDSVTYRDSAPTPVQAIRTVTFAVADTSGAESFPLAETVAVTATDQSPVLTGSGGATTYLTNAAPITVDPAVAVSDSDNAALSSGRVWIDSGRPGDVLVFVNTSGALYGNIVGSYDAATMVLTLTSAGATASLTQWAAALGSVTFSTSAGAGGRTVSFAVHDGSRGSNTVSRSVVVGSLTHTVTFDSRGGEAEPVETVVDGGFATAPASDPTRDGYTFAHWSASIDGPAYDFATPVTADLTLYAAWTPVTAPSMPSTPPATPEPPAGTPVAAPPSPPASTGRTCDGLAATVVGTGGDDVLVGTPGDDVFVALGGDDRIIGRGGDDTICAGRGNDTVLSGTGHDVVHGAAGDDNIRAGAGADRVFGGSGRDRLWGGAGGDVLRGGRADHLQTARPSVVNDILRGGRGDDSLYGDGGSDRLFGGRGHDSLHGGQGRDVLRS